MNVKVLIVDDESVLRQGISEFLATDNEIEIVGSAVNGLEAIHKAHELNPDVILMDLTMPLMNGITATKTIKLAFPDIKVLVMTANLKATVIEQALKAGADGYLLKTISINDLCQSVKGILKGPVFLSPAVAEVLINETDSAKPTVSLTQREIEIIRLLAGGNSNKQIATILNLSEGTVKSHVSTLLAKLGLQRRTQAALYAHKEGLI